MLLHLLRRLFAEVKLFANVHVIKDAKIVDGTRAPSGKNSRRKVTKVPMQVVVGALKTREPANRRDTLSQPIVNSFIQLGNSFSSFRFCVQLETESGELIYLIEHRSLASTGPYSGLSGS